MSRYDDDHFWMDYEDEMMRREAEPADDPEPTNLQKFVEWFNGLGWKGELLKFVLTIAVLAILWFTHTWLAFLMLCGIVWFIKTVFF